MPQNINLAWENQEIFAVTGAFLNEALAWCVLDIFFLLLLLFLVFFFWQKSRRASKELQSLRMAHLLDGKRFDQMMKMIRLTGAFGKVRFYLLDRESESVIVDGGLSEKWNIAYQKPEMYAKLIAPQDQAKFLQLWQEFWSGKRDSFQVNYHIHQENALHYRRDYIYAPSRDSKEASLGIGTSVGIVSVDLTEFEQQVRDFTDNSLLLKTLFESLPCYVYAKDVQHDFAYCSANNEFARMVGRPLEELLGKSDFDLFPLKQDAMNFRSADFELVRERGTLTRRWFYTDCNGMMRASRVWKTLLKRTDDSEYVLGLGIDITQQERTEHMIRRRNKEFRELFDHIACGALLCEYDGTVRQINRVMCDWLGIELEEVGHLHFDELFYPNARHGETIFADWKNMRPGEAVCRKIESQRNGAKTFLALGVAIHGTAREKIVFSIFDLSNAASMESSVLELFLQNYGRCFFDSPERAHERKNDFSPDATDAEQNEDSLPEAFANAMDREAELCDLPELDDDDMAESEEMGFDQ